MDLTTVVERLLEAEPFNGDHHGSWCIHCEAPVDVLRAPGTAMGFTHLTVHREGCEWVQVHDLLDRPLPEGHQRNIVVVEVIAEQDKVQRETAAAVVDPAHDRMQELVEELRRTHAERPAVIDALVEAVSKLAPGPMPDDLDAIQRLFWGAGYRP